MRKIAILGRGGTVALAPFKDMEWEIWGMPWIFFPRVTRLYEPHTEEACQNAPGKDRDSAWLHIAREKYKGIPVYCDPSRMHAFGDDAIEYPLEAVKASLPRSYFENSICYELAHALYEGVGKGDVIGLYGVHMMGRSEFTWQRACVTWLIGLAEGRGVEVYIPPGSPLFMSGYEAGRYGPYCRERNVNAITGA